MRGLRVGLLVAVLLSACACKQKTSRDTGGEPTSCDSISGKVSGLYKAAAERTKMTPEEVSDNTAMVIAECRTAPAHVIGCVQKVTSVAQLESVVVNLAVRWSDRHAAESDVLWIVLGAIATVVVSVGADIGGRMVYAMGWRPGRD